MPLQWNVPMMKNLNIETKDAGVIGAALCLDSEEFDNDTIGSYCYFRN